MVVDAKYKRHWEELQEHGWQRQDEDLRERHRTDLLQILAYANLVPTKQVSVAWFTRAPRRLGSRSLGVVVCFIVLNCRTGAAVSACV